MTADADADASISACFAPGLLSAETRDEVRHAYACSEPYLHAVLGALIDEDLLREARKEIVEELRFADKETDIYKVNQTGDLANLDGLESAEADRLKSLLKVRNALYSSQFRTWLEQVTGCGKLSGKTKDMSIADYRAGCHLLNHDDVIATRRLSYILYLPDPAEPWKPEWGGALELYPVESKGTPSNKPSKVVPPKYNQFVFFAVQPGHSFHSVEEVVAEGRSRLSISGWFHRPKEGEEGYEPEDETKEKQESSLEMLSSKASALPFAPYPDSLALPIPGTPLSKEDTAFLSHFLNPAYLTIKTQAQLFERFGDDSNILLTDFLRKDLADRLEKGLLETDGRDGLRWWERGEGASVQTPKHALGEDEERGWRIEGPPHKQRFLALGSSSPTPVSAADLAASASEAASSTDPSTLLQLLSQTLFPSPAFRCWLANVTQLVPMARRPTLARRFRPGLDYTLARSDEEAVLDVTLNLTPDVVKAATAAAGEGKKGPRGIAGKAASKKPKLDGGKEGAGVGGTPSLSRKQGKELRTKWESGEVGGWECYMAPHEGADDPAVYRSGKAEKRVVEEMEVDGLLEDEEQGDEEGKEGEEEGAKEEDEDEDDSDDDSDFDGVLLNLTPDFNTLGVVLRDEGVMRFVKYLSASAGGSRWDVVGEWEVGSLEDDESGAEAQ